MILSVGRGSVGVEARGVRNDEAKPSSQTNSGSSFILEVSLDITTRFSKQACPTLVYQ